MQPKSLGINSLDENASIYPNPFSISITIESTENNTVDIYNTLGKQLTTYEIIQGKNTLHLASLPSGIYYLKTRNQSWIKKVIKQ
jgi:hypothetical protein